MATAAVFDYAVVADAGNWNDLSKSVRNSIEKAGIHGLILPGDNLYDPFTQYDEVWSHWVKDGFKFDAVAIGNHNLGYKKEIKYFRMPGEFYSVNVAPQVRFVVLNSDNVDNAAAQAEFLANTLIKAPEKFIFIVYHHPSYTISDRHPWTEKGPFQKAIRTVIWKYRSKISALLLGHDHIASVVSFNDLPAIISGAVWELKNVSPVDYTDQGVHVKTQWLYDQKNPHWTHLSVDTTKGTFTLHFVRAVDSQVTCSVIFSAKGDRGVLQPNCRGVHSLN